MKKCNKCQQCANQLHQPAERLHSVLAPWLFMNMRMDIVGTLIQAPEKVRFLLILTNNFFKRVEGCAFKQVRENEVIDFV